jgi:hypothetical protein
MFNSIGKKMPYERAAEMIPQLKRQGITRSNVRLFTD